MFAIRRRLATLAPALVACLLAVLPAALARAASSSAVAPTTLAPLLHPQPPLTTPWTAGVSSRLPLPEYPRPQFERPDWENLNGQWGYEPCAIPGLPPPLTCPEPFNQTLPETILVPFPVQAPLSGIARGDTAGWYRRLFTVPAGWRGQRVQLNFGAVSWRCQVWVNHHLVGRHAGDYDGFSFDVTRELNRHGQNELIVGYSNPIGAAGEPVGKQAPGSSGGITHSAARGIWQTVWLEPVATQHLTDLELVPDPAHARLVVRPTVAGGTRGLTLSVLAVAGTRRVASASGPAGRALSLPIPHQQLWWPWQPYLYGLRVALRSGSRTVDRASSYFGMRSVTLGRVAGATRILINGQFIFQTGGLDQGYWPDGVYTAPSDAAMRFDVAEAKTLGYDMLRGHAKVQADRWYLWADRLGLLVWQDMPGTSHNLTHAPTREARAEFRAELARVVVQRRSHPSIVTWIPFNEGWGQFDLSGVTAEVRRLAPGTLVDTQSGSANCCDAQEVALSDIRDSHLYSGPYAAPPDRRASVVGEYGGVLPFPPRAHRWPGPLYSVGNRAGIWPMRWITGVLRRQYAMLEQEMRAAGLSGSVFTEYDSPEQELGLVSYDREAVTVSPGLMRALNLPLIQASLRLGGPLRKLAHPALPAGTVGLWPLTVAHGSTSLDVSSHHHPLMLLPGARFTTGPHRRTALVLPGAGIALTTEPVLATGGPITVSAWLRSDRYGQTGTAVAQEGAAGSEFALGVWTDRGGQGQARAGTTALGNLPPQTRTWWSFAGAEAAGCSLLTCGVRVSMGYDDGRDAVRRGSWHFVTGVIDRSTLTISIYVDGEPVNVGHLTRPVPSRGPLVLGAGVGVSGTASDDGFTGAIGDLRVYDRALSPGEVWQLFLASRGAAP